MKTAKSILALYMVCGDDVAVGAWRKRIQIKVEIIVAKVRRIQAGRQNAPGQGARIRINRTRSTRSNHGSDARPPAEGAAGEVKATNE